MVVKRPKQPIREIKHHFLKETQTGVFISELFRMAFALVNNQLKTTAVRLGQVLDTER